MFTGWFRRVSVVDLLKASEANAHKISYQDKVHKENGHKKTTGQSASLKRVYKLTDLVYLGICNVVGSGIYVLAGTAGKDAGSALLISLFFGLFSAGISALCFAEFASRIPVIGGSYVYLYSSSGEILGFLTGLVKVITQMCSCAINAIGAVGYLRSFIQSLYNNDNRSQQLDDSVFFGTDIYGEIISVNIIAPCLILIFMCIALYDVAISSKFMNLAATWNILLLVFFAVAGLMLFDSEIFSKPCNINVVETFGDECPNDTNNSFMPFGLSGVIAASTITFWSFAGSENIASVAEETLNPTRDIPKAIYITLTIVFILFELVTLALFGMVPFQSLDETAALSEAFSFHNELLLQRICAFGAFSTMSILLFAKIIAAPRYLFRIGVDGLVCKIFAFIHPQTQTPFMAITTFGCIAMFISMFFDLSSVLSFASTTTLLEYTMVAVGTLVMRYCPPSLIVEDKNRKRSEIREDSANRGYSDDLNANEYSMSLKGDIYITSFWTDRRIFLLIWFYFLICLFTCYIGFSYDYIVNEMELDIVWIVVLIICCGIIFIIACTIIYLDCKLPWKNWIRGGKDAVNSITFVPFSPFMQLILIIINCALIASGGLLLLLQVLALCLVAFIVYAVYGYKHSKLGNKFRAGLLEMNLK